MSVTLASMGFNGFIGAGLAPTPAAGQLDSDFWRIDAASGGLSDYGATQGTGTFGRGAFTAANNPTTGGVYALDRGAGDAAFAIQQSGSAFVPSGTVTLRVQHTGPSPLTSLSFDFEGLFRNNADRGTQVTFSYAVQSAATEPASFTTLGDLGFLTPTALTAGASFTFLDLPAQTVAATLNTGDYVFARWTFADASGSGSRDEVGFDNVLISGTPGTPAATIAITPGNLILAEGDSGTTAFTFTVTRSADAGAGSATLGLVGSAGLDASDIASITVDGVSVAPADYAAFAVTFATPGDNTVEVVVNVQGDTTPEADEPFALALSAPSAGYTIGSPFTATATILNDDIALTDISVIQGSGRTSAFAGNGLSYTIEGVVTGDYQNGDADAGRNLQGFYVQMLTGDGNAATSDGIFVFQNDGASFPVTNVQVGDIVRVTGTVRENFTETQLFVANSATGITVTQPGAFTAGQVITTFAADVSLPASGTVTASNGRVLPDLENVEGMLIRLPDPLVITEGFNLDRFGEIRVVQGEAPIQFTQTDLPDPAGYAAYVQELAARSLLIDDGLNVQNPNPITLLGQPILTGTAPQIGDTISGGLVGNLGYGFNEFRLQPANAPGILDTQPREAAPGRDGGDVKVATANLLNFFTTLNAGGATTGPGGSFQPRGANNAPELLRQQEKLLTELAELDADVLVLNEIENNGFGADSAIATLVDLLNDKVFGVGGPAPWTFVDPGTDFLGGDAISVGILYRSDRIELAAGSTVEVLDDSDLPALIADGLLPGDFLDQSTVGGVFDGVNTSRAVLVATLAEIDSGEAFTLAAVHNKSKSGIGTGLDSDALDGAGNWNNQRLLATQALDAFLKTSPTGIADPDLLLMGDFNSYAREVSIRHLTESAGFRYLIEERLGPDAFSFVFDGQKGYLDYALASRSLAGFVRGVHEWHANAPEFDALDYNLDFGRPAGIFDGTVPWRYSDHDPLVVNLLLDPAALLQRDGLTIAVSDSVQELVDAALAGDVVRLDGPVAAGTVVTIGADGLIIDVGPQGGLGFQLSDEPVEAPPQTIAFRGSGDLLIQGNAADNVITDASGNSLIFALEGQDRADGRQGNDTILGGGGNDTLRGGLGDDELFGDDDADLLLGDRGADRLVGGEGNDTLNGGEDEDVLEGGEGNDRLLGGGSDDRLVAGGGSDFLRGDGGDDAFVFAASDPGGRIVIADFDANGNDVVELLGFAGLDAFSDIAGRLRELGTSTVLQVEDTRIVFRDTALASLDASDFLFT